MQIEIVNKQKNPLLKREEITFETKEEKGSPLRKAVREKIAALSNSNPELVIIEKINKKFGSHDFKGTAFVYDDKKSLEKTELEYLISKNTGIKKTKEQKAEKKEAAPAKTEKAPAEKK